VRCLDLLQWRKRASHVEQKAVSALQIIAMAGADGMGVVWSQRPSFSRQRAHNCKLCSLEITWKTFGVP